MFNALFPKRCLVCKQPSNRAVCHYCWPKIPLPEQFGENCNYLYKLEKIKPLLYSYKFGYHKIIGKEILKPIFENISMIRNYDIVTGIPSHWTRIWRRHFDHIEYPLARLPNYQKILKRQKRTGYLYNKSLEQRQNTISGAFKLLDPNINITGKSILIIDDIYTSGATFNEAKRTLMPSAPKLIDGFFLCHA